MPDLEQNTSILRLESRLASLEELLTALERTVIEQSEQLDAAARVNLSLLPSFEALMPRLSVFPWIFAF